MRINMSETQQNLENESLFPVGAVDKWKDDANLIKNVIFAAYNKRKLINNVLTSNFHSQNHNFWRTINQLLVASHAHKRTHTHIHTQTHTDTLTRTHHNIHNTHTHTHTDMHTHTHTYTHKHSHTHTYTITHPRPRTQARTYPYTMAIIIL